MQQLFKAVRQIVSTVVSITPKGKRVIFCLITIVVAYPPVWHVGKQNDSFDLIWNAKIETIGLILEIYVNDSLISDSHPK